MTRRIAFATMLGLLTSLAQAEEPNDEARLDASLKKWRELKDKHSGDYAYKVRWSSFSGFGHETEVVIRCNKVVERRYREFNLRALPVAPPRPDKSAPEKPREKGWIEKGKDIGSHRQGAAAKTLDELYAEAVKVLKREPTRFEKRHVRFDKQGLLLACFTVDSRIADDAPTKGVIISSISLHESDESDDKAVHKSPNGKPFPCHWGAPPKRQTRDLRQLPGGYGRGSGTLARWIQENLDRDANARKE